MRQLRDCAFLLSLLLGASSLASAQLTYTFQFTPETLIEGAEIEPFTVSFQSQDFVTDGSSLNFEPFEIIAGSNSVSIAAGESVDNASNGTYCFLFAASPSQLDLGGCGVGGGQGIVIVGGFGTLPTTLGDYSYDTFNSVVLESSGGAATDISNFDVQLTISAPESSSLPLAGFGGTLALGLGLLQRRRHARCLSSTAVDKPR